MTNIGRNILLNDGYKPLFSGHETFPLRYGWLKKAYDAVATCETPAKTRDLFLSDDAIARFGVGKNMVASMRHWATCCGVIVFNEQAKAFSTTPFGDQLFGPRGVDPFLEHPASLWLLHWQLATYAPDRPNKTTWYWTFNHYPGLDFTRDELLDGLTRLAVSQAWQRLSRKTIRNDVDCLVRTYEARENEADNVEDLLASPLSEIGLVRGQRNHFRLVRGPKRSLPTGVFIIALHEFWDRFGAQRTLSFESVAHEAGAPGRVFLLDEGDLADRLMAIEDLTHGAMKWSETAGLKQLLRQRHLSAKEITSLVRNCYASQAQGEAA